MKKCTRCLQEKLLTDFPVDSRKKSGRKSHCNKCCSAQVQERRKQQRQEDAEKYIRLRKSAQLFRNYGITIEDYNNMMVAQNFSCKICKVHQSAFERSFHVDHCHTTGKVRGLLCQGCNLGLGNFADNIDLLKAAVEYLELN